MKHPITSILSDSHTDDNFFKQVIYLAINPTKKELLYIEALMNLVVFHFKRLHEFN